MRALILGYSGSAVGDVKRNASVRDGRSVAHATVLRSKLERVAEEISQHLRHTQRIRAHPGLFPGHIGCELDVALLCHRPERLVGLTKNRANLNVLQIQ